MVCAAVLREMSVFKPQCLMYAIVNCLLQADKKVDPDGNIRKKIREIVELLVSPPHRLILDLKKFSLMCPDRLSNQEVKRKKGHADTSSVLHDRLRLSWDYNEKVNGPHIGLSCLRKL